MAAMEKSSPVLVTGAAGFIGHAVSQRLIERGEIVIGIDNLNDYYDPELKQARLANLQGLEQFRFEAMDVSDEEAVRSLVADNRITRIVHLAAQAGVRYSIDNPFAYQKSNLQGHLALLEASRHAENFEHLVYASSSSVYGDKPMGGAGFTEEEPATDPVSLYAATKRSCELMSQSYAKLYGFPQTGLRFFTVYGPWGRPDMAYFGFTQKILAGQPIEVYGEGKMARDFTYIDDIVSGIIKALNHLNSGYHIFNLGNHKKEKLRDMISYLEELTGVVAQKQFLPMQPGDVHTTYAEISHSQKILSFTPKVSLKEGLSHFISWYQEFFMIS